jgi:V-type H+-transporting ATPase subunit a
MYSATCNEDNHLWPECETDSTIEGADLCPLDYGGTGDGCQPPNLITTLMNMALMPGSVAEPLYQGQAAVQVALLLLAGISVPVLLVAKPLVMKQQMNEHAYDEPSSFSEDALIDDLGDAKVSGMVPHRGGHGAHGGGGGGGHAEHDFSEVVIHQAIETIEFVLGMVSNTASYLRLWALSLAHTELATVFWKKAMVAAINSGNPVAIVMGYGVFAATTFAVLLAMDVLECFLHALRLHWVEFQNKFYKADGQKFTPLSFRKILNAV